jgi:hypothetical protein
MYVHACICLCVCVCVCVCVCEKERERERERKMFSTEFLCYEKLFAGAPILYFTIYSVFSIYIEIINVNTVFRCL